MNEGGETEKEEQNKKEAKGEEEAMLAMEGRTAQMRKEESVKKAEFMKEGREDQEKRVLSKLMSKRDQLKATPLTSQPLEAISEIAPWKKKEATEQETTIEEEEKQ